MATRARVFSGFSAAFRRSIFALESAPLGGPSGPLGDRELPLGLEPRLGRTECLLDLGIGEAVVAGHGLPGGRVHDGVLDHDVPLRLSIMKLQSGVHADGRDAALSPAAARR
jgi:hypothetical protein